MRSIRFFVLVLLFCTLLSSRTMACVCMKQELEQYYANADFIFVARILSTQKIIHNQVKDEYAPQGEIIGKYYLVRVFKGNVTSLSNVRSSITDDCGINLSVGVTYIFFANSKGRIDACGGTQKYIADDESHKK